MGPVKPSPEHVEARPATSAGMRAFIVTPFTRLARAHGASTMADAMVATALAGSLFFNVPPGTARGPVLRYLVITMLPFTVISPLIGPAIDRMKGGHRLMVLASTIARVGICFLMISNIPRTKNSPATPAFFLLAMCLLVAQKAYGVARSALVPTVVATDAELLQANSKLSRISILAGLIGIIPAALADWAFGPQWSIVLAMLTYVVASALAIRIPRGRVATKSADATERHELRGASIIMAGSAMGLLRMCVGFLTLLVAFDFRGGGRPAWQFGVVAGAALVSPFLGTIVAPRVRELTSEENLLTGVVALVVVGAAFGLFAGDLVGASIVGACVGFAAGAGRLAFDSILQRDAPDANRGRAFARFETRFQVAFVVGALIPVLPGLKLDVSAGLAIILAVGLFALSSYVVARLSYAHRTGTSQNAATAAAVEIEERFAEVSGEVKGRLTAAPRSLLRRLRHGPAHDAGPDPGADPGHVPGLAPDPDDPTRLVGPPQQQRRAGPTDDATRPDRPDGPAAPHGPGPGSAAPPVESTWAWTPPPEEATTEYPWEPPPEPEPDPGAYLADLDDTVANPYPWSEAPTRHDGPPAPVAPGGPRRRRRR